MLKVQEPIATLRLPFVTLLSLLSCAARPSPKRWLLFIPVASLGLLSMLYTHTDDVFMDYTTNLCHATNLFMMSDFLLLTDVQNELRKKGQVSPISERSFWDRFKWSFDLYTSFRGVGWEHEATPYIAHPKRPYRGRLHFILRQLLNICEICALYMLADLLMELNPSFHKPYPRFSAQKWWMRPTVLGHPLTVKASLSTFYCMASMVSVAAGLSDPSEWPPLFGSFGDAYSVHNLWRRVWHQNYRRFFLAHATFVANKLNPPNKLVRGFLKLYVAFFISSIVHCLGDYAIIHSWNMGAMKFFMLQPLAIAFEQFISHLVRLAGIRVPKWTRRTVGYLWVSCWFTATLPMWLEPVVGVGFDMPDGWQRSMVISIADRIRAFIPEFSFH